MSTKRELVQNAFHNQNHERVPVGFWFHFLNGDEFNKGIDNPEILQKNLQGHKKFIEEFDPDFVKIMTDSVFTLPIDYSGIHTAEDLKALKPVPKDHPFFEKSVELVRGVRELAGEDRLVFYNVFSPFSQLNMALSEVNPLETKKVLTLLEQDPEAVAKALDRIADNLILLIQEVVKPGLADGIYLSANNPNRQIPAEMYTAFISPSEKKILEAAKELAPDHILHICGYAGNKNILSVYRDYPVSVVNWATKAEGLNLREGKEYFGGRAVIGGFDNVKEGILYSGTKEEIEQYVEQLLEGADTSGIILGADCTVPGDIDLERLNWVREKAAEVSTQK